MIYKSFNGVNNDTCQVQDYLPDTPDNDIEDMKSLIALAMNQIAALQQRNAILEQRVAALEEQKATQEQEQRTPLPSGITKLQFQLFENFNKPENERPKTQAKVQIKLYVWAPNKIKGYWLIPVHRPDRVDGRKRIPQLMQTIRDLGQEYICYAGRLASIEVYMDHNHKLMVRLAGLWQDQVTPPRSKPSNAAANAPMYRWYCDVVANSD